MSLIGVTCAIMVIPDSGFFMIEGGVVDFAFASKHTFRCMPKGLPKYVASRVSQAGFVTKLVHITRFHPKVSPRIMLRPTLRARRLFLFPPLLIPTRG